MPPQQITLISIKEHWKCWECCYSTPEFAVTLSHIIKFNISAHIAIEKRVLFNYCKISKSLLQARCKQQWEVWVTVMKHNKEATFLFECWTLNYIFQGFITVYSRNKNNFFQSNEQRFLAATWFSSQSH